MWVTKETFVGDLVLFGLIFAVLYYAWPLAQLVFAALRRAVAAELPPVRIGDRVRALPCGSVPATEGSTFDPTVEGTLVGISDGYAKVRTDAGDTFDCFHVGVVLLVRPVSAPESGDSVRKLEPISVVAVRVPASLWQARKRNHSVPVGDGKTMDEAVGNLLLKLNLRRREVKIDIIEDPGYLY